MYGIPGHISDYLEKTDLPETFLDMHLKQHQSDSVRIALLKKYGGLWLDVDTILLQDVKEFCFNSTESNNKNIMCAIYNPQCSTQQDGFQGNDRMESYFIMTTKNNPYIDKVHWTFNEFWKDVQGVPRNIIEHPLFKGKVPVDFGCDMKEY